MTKIQTCLTHEFDHSEIAKLLAGVTAPMYTRGTSWEGGNTRIALKLWRLFLVNLLEERIEAPAQGFYEKLGKHYSNIKTAVQNIQTTEEIAHQLAFVQQSQPREKKRFFEKMMENIREEVKKLKDGDKLIIPTGYSLVGLPGHTMLARIQKTGGTFSIDYLTTGAGLEQGERVILGSEIYATPWVSRVQNILPDALWEYLSSEIKCYPSSCFFSTKERTHLFKTYLVPQIPEISSLFKFEYDDCLSPSELTELKNSDHPGVTSYALMNFSAQDIQTLKTLTETLQKTLNNQQEALFKRIQAININRNDYKTMAFTPEEAGLLKELLNESRLYSLSQKIVHIKCEKVEASHDQFDQADSASALIEGRITPQFSGNCWYQAIEAYYFSEVLSADRECFEQILWLLKKQLLAEAFNIFQESQKAENTHDGQVSQETPEEAPFFLLKSSLKQFFLETKALYTNKKISAEVYQDTVAWLNRNAIKVFNKELDFLENTNIAPTTPPQLPSYVDVIQFPQEVLRAPSAPSLPFYPTFSDLSPENLHRKLQEITACREILSNQLSDNAQHLQHILLADFFRALPAPIKGDEHDFWAKVPENNLAEIEVLLFELILSDYQFFSARISLLVKKYTGLSALQIAPLINQYIIFVSAYAVLVRLNLRETSPLSQYLKEGVFFILIETDQDPRSLQSFLANFSATDAPLIKRYHQSLYFLQALSEGNSRPVFNFSNETSLKQEDLATNLDLRMLTNFHETSVIKSLGDFFGNLHTVAITKEDTPQPRYARLLYLSLMVKQGLKHDPSGSFFIHGRFFFLDKLSGLSPNLLLGLKQESTENRKIDAVAFKIIPRRFSSRLVIDKDLPPENQTILDTYRLAGQEISLPHSLHLELQQLRQEPNLQMVRLLNFLKSHPIACENVRLLEYLSAVFSEIRQPILATGEHPGLLAQELSLSTAFLPSLHDFLENVLDDFSQNSRHREIYRQFLWWLKVTLDQIEKLKASSGDDIRNFHALALCQVQKISRFLEDERLSSSERMSFLIDQLALLVYAGSYQEIYLKRVEIQALEVGNIELGLEENLTIVTVMHEFYQQHFDLNVELKPLVLQLLSSFFGPDARFNIRYNESEPHETLCESLTESVPSCEFDSRSGRFTRNHLPFGQLPQEISTHTDYLRFFEHRPHMLIAPAQSFLDGEILIYSDQRYTIYYFPKVSQFFNKIQNYQYVLALTHLKEPLKPDEEKNILKLLWNNDDLYQSTLPWSERRRHYKSALRKKFINDHLYNLPISIQELITFKANKGLIIQERQRKDIWQVIPHSVITQSRLPPSLKSGFEYFAVRKADGTKEVRFVSTMGGENFVAFFSEVSPNISESRALGLERDQHSLDQDIQRISIETEHLLSGEKGNSNVDVYFVDENGKPDGSAIQSEPHALFRNFCPGEGIYHAKRMYFPHLGLRFTVTQQDNEEIVILNHPYFSEALTVSNQQEFRTLFRTFTNYLVVKNTTGKYYVLMPDDSIKSTSYTGQMQLIQYDPIFALADFRPNYVTHLQAILTNLWHPERDYIYRGTVERILAINIHEYSQNQLYQNLGFTFDEIYWLKSLLKRNGYEKLSNELKLISSPPKKREFFAYSLNSDHQLFHKAHDIKALFHLFAIYLADQQYFEANRLLVYLHQDRPCISTEALPYFTRLFQQPFSTLMQPEAITLRLKLYLVYFNQQSLISLHSFNYKHQHEFDQKLVEAYLAYIDSITYISTDLKLSAEEELFLLTTMRKASILLLQNPMLSLRYEALKSQQAIPAAYIKPQPLGRTSSINILMTQLEKKHSIVYVDIDRGHSQNHRRPVNGTVLATVNFPSFTFPLENIFREHFQEIPHEESSQVSLARLITSGSEAESIMLEHPMAQTQLQEIEASTHRFLTEKAPRLTLKNTASELAKTLLDFTAQLEETRKKLLEAIEKFFRQTGEAYIPSLTEHTLERELGFYEPLDDAFLIRLFNEADIETYKRVLPKTPNINQKIPALHVLIAEYLYTLVTLAQLNLATQKLDKLTNQNPQQLEDMIQEIGGIIKQQRHYQLTEPFAHLLLAFEAREGFMLRPAQYQLFHAVRQEDAKFFQAVTGDGKSTLLPVLVELTRQQAQKSLIILVPDTLVDSTIAKLRLQLYPLGKGAATFQFFPGVSDIKKELEHLQDVLLRKEAIVMSYEYWQFLKIAYTQIIFDCQGHDEYECDYKTHQEVIKLLGDCVVFADEIDRLLSPCSETKLTHGAPQILPLYYWKISQTFLSFFKDPDILALLQARHEQGIQLKTRKNDHTPVVFYLQHKAFYHETLRPILIEKYFNYLCDNASLKLKAYLAEHKTHIVQYLHDKPTTERAFTLTDIFSSFSPETSQEERKEIENLRSFLALGKAAVNLGLPHCLSKQPGKDFGRYVTSVRKKDSPEVEVIYDENSTLSQPREDTKPIGRDTFFKDPLITILFTVLDHYDYGLRQDELVRLFTDLLEQRKREKLLVPDHAEVESERLFNTWVTTVDTATLNHKLKLSLFDLSNPDDIHLLMNAFSMNAEVINHFLLAYTSTELRTYPLEFYNGPYDLVNPILNGASATLGPLPTRMEIILNPTILGQVFHYLRQKNNQATHVLSELSTEALLDHWCTQITSGKRVLIDAAGILDEPNLKIAQRILGMTGSQNVQAAIFLDDETGEKMVLYRFDKEPKALGDYPENSITFYSNPFVRGIDITHPDGTEALVVVKSVHDIADLLQAIGRMRRYLMSLVEETNTQKIQLGHGFHLVIDQSTAREIRRFLDIYPETVITLDHLMVWIILTSINNQEDTLFSAIQQEIESVGKGSSFEELQKNMLSLLDPKRKEYLALLLKRQYRENPLTAEARYGLPTRWVKTREVFLNSAQEQIEFLSQIEVIEDPLVDDTLNSLIPEGAILPPELEKALNKMMHAARKARALMKNPNIPGYEGVKTNPTTENKSNKIGEKNEALDKLLNNPRIDLLPAGALLNDDLSAQQHQRNRQTVRVNQQQEEEQKVATNTQAAEETSWAMEALFNPDYWESPIEFTKMRNASQVLFPENVYISNRFLETTNYFDPSNIFAEELTKTGVEVLVDATNPHEPIVALISAHEAAVLRALLHTPKWQNSQRAIALFNAIHQTNIESFSHTNSFRLPDPLKEQLEALFLFVRMFYGETHLDTEKHWAQAINWVKARHALPEFITFLTRNFGRTRQSSAHFEEYVAPLLDGSFVNAKEPSDQELAALANAAPDFVDAPDIDTTLAINSKLPTATVLSTTVPVEDYSLWMQGDSQTALVERQDRPTPQPASTALEPARKPLSFAANQTTALTLFLSRTEHTSSYRSQTSLAGQDPRTGQPIFIVNIQDEVGETAGWIKLYAHPMFCRSEDGARHNIIGAGGLFEDLDFEAKSAQEICQYLPPTMFETVAQSAARSGFNSALFATGNVAGYAAEKKGVSRPWATIIGKTAGLGLFFVSRVCSHLGDEFSAGPTESLLKALSDTVQMAVVNIGFSAGALVFNWFSSKLKAQGYSKAAYLCDGVTRFLPYATFAHQFSTQGPLLTVVNFASGAAAGEVVNRIGTSVVDHFIP
ncbi:MAG: hypothetical protein COV52_07220 [Gammaproteobacteria bacterium CG11_big_fil_rev_8_21_14_0_20_46_22]|nr:MAG: hypothetical protein COW05_00235 [Gammaproteobacteria bacterium CG12_big_fil_rev_8_21_14_0_65_46_12]PIR10824.1 MAG: hypothetical protein COV52_07220 [Gammaproteobacteria bacterium CG11_big_fil_rev_8_21_14_0_20_46_22]